MQPEPLVPSSLGHPMRCLGDPADIHGCTMRFFWAVVVGHFATLVCPLCYAQDTLPSKLGSLASESPAQLPVTEREADRFFDEGWSAEHGIGRKIDKAAAAALYKRAVQGNHPLATCRYGQLQYDIELPGRDRAIGAKLCRESRDRVVNLANNDRHPIAECILARCYEFSLGPENPEMRDKDTSDECATEYYARSATHGNVIAMTEHAWHLLNTIRKQEQNVDEAIRLLKSASSKGDARAMYLLGECYWSGVGVKKDIKAGFESALKAANLGFKEAMTNVAYAYFTGHGVVQDKSESLKWCLAAAERNEPAAVFRLGVFSEQGEFREKDARQALEHYLRAAELEEERKGSIGEGEPGVYLLAHGKNDVRRSYAAMSVYRLCRSGIGVDKVPPTAVKWLKSAAGFKNPAAILELAKCCESGWGMPRVDILSGRLLRQDYESITGGRAPNFTDAIPLNGELDERDRRANIEAMRRQEFGDKMP